MTLETGFQDLRENKTMYDRHSSIWLHVTNITMHRCPSHNPSENLLTKSSARELLQNIDKVQLASAASLLKNSHSGGKKVKDARYENINQ